MAYFGDYHFQFYGQGLGGFVSDLPFLFEELQQRAETVLPEGIFGYVRGGSGDGHTQDLNVAALRRYGFTPRMLRDRTVRQMRTTFLGRTFQSPVFLCPVGVLGAVHPRGDLETAAAAGALDVPVMFSTLTAAPLEEVAAARGGAFGVFQLYPSADRELNASFIARAEKSGFDAIAVTVDTGTLGWRPRDLANGYMPMLQGRCLANYLTDPRFLEIAGVKAAEELSPQQAGLVWASIFAKPDYTWEDIDWLRSLTKLPIIVKGLCDPRDVRLAAEHGVDAVLYSNHGGRQANGGLPAIDGLAAAVEAAAGEIPVLFDSGVRDGVDLLRAVALGAAMVGVGRPYVYGLALAGQRGVEHVLRCLLAEADLTMAVNCYPDLADLVVSRHDL